MSFAGLLDHTARIWSYSESLDESRVTTRHYTLGEPAVECAMTRKAARVARMGPGNAPVGARSWYADVDTAVKERDVVEVYEGPNAPARLEVHSVDRPRGHHTECLVIEYLGKLPDLTVVES